MVRITQIRELEDTQNRCSPEAEDLVRYRLLLYKWSYRSERLGLMGVRAAFF